MDERGLDYAVRRFKRSLQQGHASMILLDLVFAVHTFQNEIQKIVEDIPMNFYDDTDLSVDIEHLSRLRLGLIDIIHMNQMNGLIDNPEDIVHFYQSVWQQPEWSAPLILGSLTNPLTRVLVVFDGIIVLLGKRISPEHRDWYNRLVGIVNKFKDIHQHTTQYLSTLGFPKEE